MQTWAGYGCSEHCGIVIIVFRFLGLGNARGLEQYSNYMDIFLRTVLFDHKRPPMRVWVDLIEQCALTSRTCLSFRIWIMQMVFKRAR